MSSKKNKRIAAGRKAAEQKKTTESKSEGQVLAEEANKEKDGKLLKVARKDAAALLGAIGFKETRKYDNALLTKRLGKLKTYMESYEGTLDGDSQELVDKIIEAGPDGITVTGEEPKGVKKDAKEGKGTKPAGKGKKASEGKKTSGNGLGKPGVIATIQELITAKAMDKDELLKALAKKFPDRPVEGMAKTIQAQLPKRMAKEKGIKITKDSEGRFHVKK